MQEKVFDLFSTTKEAGRDRGLALVQGILPAHGGATSLRSGPGQGSTFSSQTALYGKRGRGFCEIVPPVAKLAGIARSYDSDWRRMKTCFPLSVAKALRKKPFYRI